MISVLVPIIFTLTNLDSFRTPNNERNEKTIRRLQGIIKDYSSTPEGVLFISERQLLTFGNIHGVQLIPDYERVFLMEMVMAGNQPYLDQFHTDIQAQRFSLIINEPLYTTTKGSPVRFGEENDAWVQEVSKPLLCYYRPLQDARMLLMQAEIQMLVPRTFIAEECLNQ